MPRERLRLRSIRIRRPGRGRAGPEGRAERPAVEAPAAPGSGRRAVDWNATATMLTGIAAVAGLLFTGISTYYGSRTARDQLEQSVQDANVSDSRQAEQVTVWPRREKNGGAGLVLTNRSPAPVSDVYLRISAIPGASDRNAEPVHLGPALSIRALAPCSTVFLPASVIRAELGPVWTPDTALEARTLWFRDAQGRRWRREPTGELEGGWISPEEARRSHSNQWHAALRKQVTGARPVEHCGSDA
ncbi:hypothetical protein GCM10010273_14910 [Streptomyces lavendulocolor]